MSAGEGTDRTAVARLRRWEDAGGTWRVLSQTSGLLRLALYRCDGGEEVDQLTSDDPWLVTYVGRRRSSEDEPSGSLPDADQTSDLR